jgi:peptidoglycan/LPS O-acetylase OafA/YrhL
MTFNLSAVFQIVNFTEWFTNVFAKPSLGDLGRNLILAKVNVNAVTWTIIPEIVCSLLLPLLAYVHGQTKLAGHLAILIALAAIGWCAGDASAQYLFCFYLGFFGPRVIGERGDGFPINLSASTDFDLCIDESYIGRVDLLVAVT